MGNEKMLLEGLEEEVTIENIDQFLQQQGVIVQVHVGRNRGTFELAPKVMGVNLKSDSVKGFFREYVKNGKLSFIPKEVEDRFHRVESGVREMRKRMAIGYDNSFMPIEVYKEFSEKVKEFREDYLAVRDDVIESWDSLKAGFENNLNSALSEMKTDDKEMIFNAIIAKYPSKEEYHDSFYLDTTLRAFPTMENLSLLDDNLSEEVKESSIKENLKLVHEVLGFAFNEAFRVSNKIYKAYENTNKLASRTKGAIDTAIQKMKTRNLFNHPVVDQLIDDLGTLYNTKDADDGVELTESIMAKSYGACLDLDLMSYLDLEESELSLEDLEILAKSYDSYAA